MSGDSADYTRRKADFDRCLTVYGRNSVLEALQCPGVVCERLHLADSNRPAEILDRILRLAQDQGASVRHHARGALAHISHNAREDQGVAADLRWTGYRQIDAALAEPAGGTLLAVDGVTNPQNLGMLVRSATAAGVRGIVLPKRGGCEIGPLVIKASAGSLFRAPLLRCAALPEALAQLRACGWRVAILEAAGARPLFSLVDGAARVFVLGSETRGISAEVAALADERVSVPMANGVESLNVAVTAALVGYYAAIAGATLSG